MLSLHYYICVITDFMCIAVRSQAIQGVGRLLVVVVEGINLKACSNGTHLI